jgi:primosomal protein N' (replication factor Y)
LVLREIIARPGRTRRGLERTLRDEIETQKVGKALDHLIKQGWTSVEEREQGAKAGRITTVRLTVPPEAIPMEGGIRMRGVLARLSEAGGQLDMSTLVQLEGTGARDAVRRLVTKSLVVLDDREDRDAASSAELTDSGQAKCLNAQQQVALDSIVAAERGTFLLHGVTGSGKTEVYLQASQVVRDRAKQVLVLVPEIALTPQLVGRFRARFGDQIAVLHSGLSPADRLREWRRIRAGEAHIAIGARSALFAPFTQLGLIVVDEEHDGSYKQDDGVKYNARDLAVVRGAMAGCPVVLGSATPSVETWQNAKEGRYTRLTLPERATSGQLPSVELLDMRGRPPGQPLTSELINMLRETVAAGDQAIVLYNRRGYAPVVECTGCGATYACPSCGVGSLVLHQRQGRLRCHYCGFRRDYERNCPACNTPMSELGYGTERIEEALREALPGTKISRMDADTTKGRGAHQRILSAFRDGESQVLVGTQLVAKGHDFPGVTLAAVVGVDHVLLMPDFRSAERTYGLVTQLAGRAGRGEKPGRVILQTRQSDHFVFKHVSPETPLDAFYDEEAHQRTILSHPPFARVVLIRLESASMNSAADAGNALVQRLRATADGASIQVFGPTLAPLSRLVGRWRFQIILRGRDVPHFRAWIEEVSPILFERPKKGVRLSIDVDPRNLL